MGLLDGLEKLITEHGSAAILRERIQLANDKYADLERKLKVSQELAEKSETENSQLRSKLDALSVKSAQASTLLSSECEAVLAAVCHNPELDDAHIAPIAQVSLQIATYHLEQLKASKMVSYNVTAGSDWTGQAPRTEWTIRAEGRKYLFDRGLLK